MLKEKFVDNDPPPQVKSPIYKIDFLLQHEYCLNFY